MRTFPKKHSFILMISLATAFGVLLLMLARPNGGHTGPGQNIGQSNFRIQQGKVQTLLVGGGYVDVPGADPQSFAAFDAFGSRHVGWDKSQVFCANQAMPGLQAPIQSLGNELYSDGTRTYYCSHNTQRQAQGALRYFWRQATHALAGKPYSSLYHTVRLVDDSGKTLSPVPDSHGLATDGQRFYYQGLAIPANQRPVFPIGGDSQGSPYVSDGEQVFYQNQRLNVPFSPHLQSLEHRAPGPVFFLHDQQGGPLWADGRLLNPDRPPYRLLSSSLAHAQHVLFSNENGVYFYEPVNKQAQKIGPNTIRLENYREMAPGYLSNGHDLLYFLSGETWQGGKRYGQLAAYSTYLVKLQGQAAGDWVRVGQPGLALWQKGPHWYFLNDRGASQKISAGVYRVTQPQALAPYLHENYFTSARLEAWIASGVLTPAEHTVLFEATSRLKSTWHAIF